MDLENNSNSENEINDVPNQHPIDSHTKREPEKGRSKQFIILMIIIILLSYYLFSSYGIIKRISLSLEKKQTEANIKQQEAIQDSLLKKIETLKTDTTSIERIAREKYGLIKQGERVYVVTPNIKNDTTGKK